MMRAMIIIFSLILAFCSVLMAGAAVGSADTHAMSEMDCHGSDCSSVDFSCISHCLVAASSLVDESAPFVGLFLIVVASAAVIAFVRQISSFTPIPVFAYRDPGILLTVIKRE